MHRNGKQSAKNGGGCLDESIGHAYISLPEILILKARVAQLVEPHVANVVVASSSLVSRSTT